MAGATETMTEFSIPNRHDRRANLKRAKVNLAEMSKAKSEAKKAEKPAKDLTLEMKMALLDNDEDALEIATSKALKDGWDLEDLIRAFESYRLNILISHVKQRTEAQRNGNKILLMN